MDKHLTEAQSKIMGFLHEHGDSTAKQISRGLKFELTAVESILGDLYAIDVVGKFGHHYRSRMSDMTAHVRALPEQTERANAK